MEVDEDAEGFDGGVWGGCVKEPEYVLFTGKCKRCGDIHVNRYVIDGTGMMRAEWKYQLNERCSHGLFGLNPVEEGLMVVW